MMANDLDLKTVGLGQDSSRRDHPDCDRWVLEMVDFKPSDRCCGVHPAVGGAIARAFDPSLPATTSNSIVPSHKSRAENRHRRLHRARRLNVAICTGLSSEKKT